MMKMHLFLLLAICLKLVSTEQSSDKIGLSLVPLIINNSGNSNNGNKVVNGNDSFDGNLVNGNGNGDDTNSGNVSKRRLDVLIINNSGSNNSQNEITNGNDEVDGNLVNGNGNGNNSNSGNVGDQKNGSRLATFIINNSGDDNQNNTVQNGNDDVSGNLVNGNDNGDNTNSGNVGNEPDYVDYPIVGASPPPPRRPGGELLDLINNSLQVILQRLNHSRVANIPDSIVILLQQVKNILINVLLDIANVLNFVRNRLRIIALSHLIDKVDVISRLLHEKNVALREIVISLNNSVRERVAELELIPPLLDKVLDLL